MQECPPEILLKLEWSKKEPVVSSYFLGVLLINSGNRHVYVRHIQLHSSMFSDLHS